MRFRSVQFDCASVLKYLNIAMFIIVLGLVGALALPFLPDKKANAFPHFSMEGLNFRDLEGEVFAINIFASWCVPCRKEHETITKLATHIPVYGIAHKDTIEDSVKFFKELGNPYTQIGYDYGGLMAGALNEGALPATFIVNQDFEILWSIGGPMNKAVLKGDALPVIKRHQ